MDGSESTSPLTIVLSAGLAIGIPLIVLLFSRRQAAAPSGAAAVPAPASGPVTVAGYSVTGLPTKQAYRSAKELRDELDSAGLIAEAGRRKDAANGFLTKGILEPALQGYLAAIWLLKVHPTPAPTPTPNPTPTTYPSPYPSPQPLPPTPTPNPSPYPYPYP